MSSGSRVRAGVLFEGAELASAEAEEVLSVSLPSSVPLRSCTRFTLPSSQLTQSLSKPETAIEKSEMILVLK